MKPEALFEIFGRGVNLYGIFIAVGLIACFIVFFLYAKRDGMDTDLQSFIFYVAIIAIVLGFVAAKFCQAIYNWIETGRFDFMSAGITVMGGLLGGAGAFLLIYFFGGNLYFAGAKKNLHKEQFGKLLRLAPICIVIAHAFGRISCLMAGCCHGAYLGDEYVFGGIYMKASDTGKWGYYVPTQLYESLFLFALFVVLSLLYFKKNNIILHIYLIAYGAWRMFIEIFRTDARGAVVLGLYPSQWTSIIFIAIGAGLLLFYHFKKIPFVIKESVAEKCETPVENIENLAAVEQNDSDERDAKDNMKETEVFVAEEPLNTANTGDNSKEIISKKGKKSSAVEKKQNKEE